MTENGELTLTVGGQRLAGWKNVRLARGLERTPSDFDLLVTERYPGEPAAISVQPGQSCTVQIGQDVALTGYVDRVQLEIGARHHEVRVTGRGKAQDLVDCQAWLRDVRGQVSFASAAALARQLAAPFGLQVLAPDGEGPVLPQFNVALTETGWEIIDRVARYAGMLAYEDAQGRIVIGKAGKDRHASGFVQGLNVETAAVIFAMDQRFSHYEAVVMSVDVLQDLAGAVGGPLDYNVRGRARDQGVPRFRPRVFVSEQMQSGEDIAQRRAEWEATRRFGRSQGVSITCDSWRDAAGQLWEPGRLATVHLPALKLTDRAWVIAEVTYRRGPEGTHADLVLMPPEAYASEPVVLQPYDWQVGRALDANPTPPTTDTGGLAP
ncbi:phage baseplate assembly protein [Pseudoroseomonas cervicalis]|uniref:phage baseplate assembly protein n=1 Tax=Teichococcus cervicalis TaxID=204525 RepID=UPI0022F18D30|nr:hypothetical protein [Pseudoroseomonas cervicalis]WBV42724.1 hypothetical protein PFY06_15990 [Pseudoroseomonas cervicalis]